MNHGFNTQDWKIPFTFSSRIPIFFPLQVLRQELKKDEIHMNEIQSGKSEKQRIFSPLGESEGVDAFECMMHSLSAIRSDDEFTTSTLLIFKVASLGIGVLLAVFGCISPIQSKRRVSSSISSVAL